MTRGPQPEQPCGTPAAAKRHARRGEPPCPACAQAGRLAQAQRRGSDPYGTSTRAVPDLRPVRNGFPEFRPYVYRGLGYDIYEDQPC